MISRKEAQIKVNDWINDWINDVDAKNTLSDESCFHYGKVELRRDIDKIYDSINDSICINCKFNLANRGGKIGCTMVAIEDCEMKDNFGCNKFESKDK